MNISRTILASLVAVIAPLSVANPAGILPIYKDKHGTVRVLLSRETGGAARGTWCDLGGAAQRGENTWQTACREAAEESCAYFKTKNWTKRTPNVACKHPTYISQEKKRRYIRLHTTAATKRISYVHCSV